MTPAQVVITFRVHGTPVTQGSKTRVGRRVIADNEARLRPWREAIRSEAQDALEAAQPGWSGAVPFPSGCPVIVDVIFFFARPKGHHGRRGLLPSAPARPTSRMDLDKLCRAVLDGCTDAGVWADDGQVVSLHAHKQWADDGPPGALINVTPL